MSSKATAAIVISKAVLAACVLNFAAFWIGAVYLGGNALNGSVQDGRYLLMNHGALKQVTRQVFEYSRWHALSLWVTHPLGVAAGMLAIHLRKRGAEQAVRAGPPGPSR